MSNYSNQSEYDKKPIPVLNYSDCRWSLEYVIHQWIWNYCQLLDNSWKSVYDSEILHNSEIRN